MTKTNLGPPGASLGFRLASGESGVALQWTGPVDLTADELCGANAAQASRRPRERAAEFLKDALAAGPRPVSELEKLAAEKGLSWKTVVRAKDDMRLRAEQRREGEHSAWYWVDPAT